MKSVTPEVAASNYTSFTTLLNKARKTLSEALDADESRKTGAGCSRNMVIQRYRTAVKNIEFALRIKPSACPAAKRSEVQSGQQILSNHLRLSLERIEALEKEAPVTSASNPSTNVNCSSVINKEVLLRNINRAQGEEIMSTIVQRTGVKLSDVEGNLDAKRALEESVIFPALNPSIFTGLRAPCKGILLYGPPGNGKTMIAKAVAEEARCTFFNISASTIMSKWVGEGEKMVKALFQMARNAQPSIIFIDEVDSMLCDRSENENGAARRVKTEFLLQFDGCTSSSTDRIVVLAATNRPQELDEAVLRRFPQRIFIDLPDAVARAALILRTFESHKTKIVLSRSELESIATATENYSFSDILALCRAAAMIPLQDVNRSNLHNISAKQIRPVCYQDMMTAIKSVRPSTSTEKRQKLREFAGACLS